MSLGETLRNARLQKGLELYDVAERTNMLIQIVENLENEDFSRIAAPLYGRSFVRLYAELLDLDPKPLVEEFMQLYSGARPPVLAKDAQRRSPDTPQPTEVAAPPKIAPSAEASPPVRHSVTASNDSGRPLTRAVETFEEVVATPEIDAQVSAAAAAAPDMDVTEDMLPEVPSEPVEPDLFTPPQRRRSYADTSTTWARPEPEERASAASIKAPLKQTVKFSQNILATVKTRSNQIWPMLAGQKRTLALAGLGVVIILVMTVSISQLFKLTTPAGNVSTSDTDEFAPPPPLYID